MVIIRKAAPGVSQQALSRFAQRARRAAGLRGKVNVLLTSSRDISALNRRFRGKDKPTDVLSFPPVATVADKFSGDIVISTEIAVSNARLYQHAAAQELKILILHGMLHLAGYDHESDRGEMARKEERLRRQLGLAEGLIQRTKAIPPSGAKRQRPTTNDQRPRAVDQRPTTNDQRRHAR